ncbi:MAG: tRNA threonylcarbamoyladenosine dehydratase [Clostridia bacterium]|nr:tRNA threonylcarbamoyladenosine dehydratase [Clostridia bacterium]
MSERFLRNEMLFGCENVSKLKTKKVIVFGIGGVGGYIVEALARSGVGFIDIVDNDTVALSNINRQILALESTVGNYKVQICKARILDINPDCTVNTYKKFFLPENSNEFDFSKYDYIIDAVDTVSAKIELADCAKKANVPIISSMGTANKIDPTKFEVEDIFKTSVDPLARIMRSELKKKNIDSLKVVYSKEMPIKNNKNNTPASNSFVPPVAGFIIAGEVIKDLMRG